jgi:hypothetical protein
LCGLGEKFKNSSHFFSLIEDGADKILSGLLVLFSSPKLTLLLHVSPPFGGRERERERERD